jgi:hypothetical protein
MARLIRLSCLLVMLPSLVLPVAAQQVTQVGRPRIAVAPDGSVAIAQEAFVGEWKVAVQVYTPAGVPKGPRHFFEGESCNSLDIWTSDLVDDVDLEFRPDGILLVLMRHAGDLSFGGDQLISAEATLGAVDASGNLLDLSDSPCVGLKIIFVGGSRQDRPRMALTGSSDVFLTVDGFLKSSNLRNVGIRVLNPDLSEAIELIIPHTDELSEQAFHMFPDVVTKGSLVGTTWHQCPIIDAQGNANECNIGAQFIRIANGQLQAAGVNQAVNTGDPPGTFSVWPSIAMISSGRSIITWADTRTGSDADVFGQLFDNENKVGGNFQISTGQGQLRRRPEVAMKDDGGFMVVWEDSSSSGFSARAREYGANGNPLGPPFALTTGASNQTAAPAVAANGNSFLYTWVGTNGGPLEIFSNLFTPTANEEEETPVAASFELSAYPSPFTNALNVSFELPEAMAVEVDLYDILGRHVSRLANGLLSSGPHKVGLGSVDLPSGLYVVKLSAGDSELTRVVVRTN